ncbi:MAG: hypothetical protein LCI00_13505 [Chloroflexi bacterium]|nr:hypothetical protein [Chloroflexota bacterium]MCC6892321.1 hypothetical protein [Anaerolineae bacterium]
MPIKAAWNNEAKREIALTFDIRWTLEEFYDVDLVIKGLMDEVDHPVHVLLDIRTSKMMPEGFMSAVQNIARKPHPNMGLMVMIGLNIFIRSFIMVYRKIYPHKPGEWVIYYAKNYEEAAAIIERNQPEALRSSA